MTVSFNVHYNLSAWATTTYSVGNRVSQSGAAYQCLKGGTASSAPSGTGSYIQPGDGLIWKWLSAIDYTSLQSWATAMFNAYNVSGQPDNFIVYLWNNGAITTTIGNSYLNQSGIAAGSFTTLITCAPGESYRDKGNGNALAFNAANGVAFDMPATGAETGQYFYVVINNWTFSGIQFRDLNAAASAATINLSGNVCKVVDCLFDGYAHVYTNGASVGVVNCVFINRCTTPLTAAWPVKWDNACTGGYVAGCTASCIGGSGGPGSVFVWLPATTGQATMINTAIFGCTNAIKSQNIVDGWNCNYCISDVSSFASDAVATNCIFSATAANEYVSPTTDLRLKSGAQSIDNGEIDTTYNKTSDDIFRTHRPQGAAWDIGAYEYGLFNLILQASSAAAYHSTPTAGGGLTVGKTLGCANNGGTDPFSSGFSSGFGIILPSVSVFLVTNKTTSSTLYSKALSAASASAASFLKVFGKAIAASQQHGSAQLFKRVATNVSAAKTQQAFGVRRFLGKYIHSATTQASSLNRFISKTPLVATSAQASSVVKTKLAGFVGFIVSVQSSALTKTTAKIISAIHTSIFAYVQRTTKELLSATTTQSAAEVTAGHLINHTTSPATSTEVAAVQMQRPVVRSFSATTAQVLATFQGKFRITIVATTTVSAASVQRQIAALRGAVDAQIATAQKLISRISGGVTAQATAATKNANKVIGVTNQAVQTLVRTPGKVLGLASVQVGLIARAISKAVVGAVSAQAVMSSTGARTLSRAYGAVGADVAALVRQMGRAFGGTSGASQASAKSVGVPLAVGQADIAALLGLLGRTHPLAVAAASGEAVTVLKTPGKLLLAVDAQVAALLRNRVHTVLVVSQQGVGVQRQVSIIRPAASQNIAAWARGAAHTFGAITQDAAHAFASRTKNLGTTQRSYQSVVAWYRFYIPPAYGPAVLVPPADGPPEPFSFGPMDPADTSVSIFDWSRRMTSGDTIVSAVVTSIPAGMNFVGPVTIQGPFVEVTTGPFSPPQVPAVYGLKCSVFFVSGRRSTFTVPVPVRVL